METPRRNLEAVTKEIKGLEEGIEKQRGKLSAQKKETTAAIKGTEDLIQRSDLEGSSAKVIADLKSAMRRSAH